MHIYMHTMKPDIKRSQINSPQDFNRLLEMRKQQIIKEAQDIAKKTAKVENALFDFELLYSVMIPKKKQQKSSSWVRNYRKRKWKEALKKANGNEQRAFAIYDQI